MVVSPGWKIDSFRVRLDTITLVEKIDDDKDFEISTETLT